MKNKAEAPRKRHPVRNAILIAVAALLVGYGGYRLVSGYIDALPKLTYAYGSQIMPVKYPACRFAVVSDLHYYDTSLGAEGEAFQAYLDYDRKLLRQSGDILNLAMESLLQSGVQFVLVSGDLTKDGEKANHEQVAAAFARLEENGIQVFVTPGNHDINNAWAYSYSGSVTSPVPTVSAQEFEDIYSDFGYGDALYRDGDSLSYVAEPVEGLWLISLDACRYRENEPGEESIISGKLSQGTETWLEGKLKEANTSGKAVIVLMHHGVVEHWKGQSKLHPDYLVEDYSHFAEMLASWGVRLVFTGHYHAQDVAMADYGGKGFLLDVETGSLVTAPCPMRWCAIDGKQYLTYSSDRLAEALQPGSDFEREAVEFLKEAVVNHAFDTLKGYKVDETDAAVIAENVGSAFAAHYTGDEDPAAAPALDTGGFKLWSRIVLATQQYVLDGLWNDPSVPGDNNGKINLFTGK